MCRMLIYLGSQPALMYDLIYGPDNSLAHQTYQPQLMYNFQNLAGMGFCSWVNDSYDSDTPFFYKTTKLPFYDNNLYRLSKKLMANCLLAHIRGVDYSTKEVVADQNAHPFKLDNCTLAFAHNGNLTQMPTMKRLMTERIKPEIFAEISGTTDSEWIYSLFLSQLRDYTGDIAITEAYDALIKTLKIIRELRDLSHINDASPVNLFVSNGKFIIVTRFIYDFGCNTGDINDSYLDYHSLWITFGEKFGKQDGRYKMRGKGARRNILIASEPLTKDRTTWIELPEYSITRAWIEDGSVIFRTDDLVV